MDLSAADRAMVRLYMAGCLHYWDQLPGEWTASSGSVLMRLRSCCGQGARPATRRYGGPRREPAPTPARCMPPPGLARECLAAGATAEQLRGCVRHLVVFAGYGPCLAATLALHMAKLLPEDTPGKVQ